MLARLISIVVAALLLALPAHAGQDHRSWSPKKASVMAGAKHVAYSDHRSVGSQHKKFRHLDRGGSSKRRVQRGYKKRYDVTERHRPNSDFKRGYKKLQRFVKRHGPKWRSHRFKKLVRAAYREGPGRHLNPGKRDRGQVTKKRGKNKNSYTAGQKHRQVANKTGKYKKSPAKGKNGYNSAKKSRKYKNGVSSNQKKWQHIVKKTHKYKKSGASHKKSRHVAKNKGRSRTAASYQKLYKKTAFRFEKKGYKSKHKKTRRIVHRGGPSKRFAPKHGKHKFIGRHGKPKCPPSRSKGYFGGGYGKGKGNGPARCQGHGYWAGKKYGDKDHRVRRYGRRDWKSQRYAHMWRAVNRYARSYQVARR